MQVRIKGNVYIYLAVLLLFIPIPWLCAWLVSILFHEFCHYLLVQLFGGRVYKIAIGIGGAEMESTALTKLQSVMALMIGPIGGLLLTFLGKWIPRTALCSCFLSVYNLLPLSFLDGGRILTTLFGVRISRIIENIFLVMASCAIIYFSLVTGFDYLLIIIVALLWLKKVKSSCKQASFKVQ